MTLKDELNYLEDRISELKEEIKKAKYSNVDAMTLQLKYMNNYRQIIVYRIDQERKEVN